MENPPVSVWPCPRSSFPDLGELALQRSSKRLRSGEVRKWALPPELSRELRPHRVRYWLHSQDPEFRPKVERLCELYLSPLPGATVESSEERGQGAAGRDPLRAPSRLVRLQADDRFLALGVSGGRWRGTGAGRRGAAQGGVHGALHTAGVGAALREPGQLLRHPGPAAVRAAPRKNERACRRAVQVRRRALQGRRELSWKVFQEPLLCRRCLRAPPRGPALRLYRPTARRLVLTQAPGEPKGDAFRSQQRERWPCP